MFNPILLDNDIDIVNDYDIELFNTSSVEGLERFLIYSQIDKNEYDFDNYHCVNFSYDLIKELNFYGFNSSITHLRVGKVGQEFDHCIVSVKLNDKIVFVDPQDDTILRLDELQECYNYDEITIFDLIGYHTVFSFDGYISNDLKNMFEVNFSNNLDVVI